MSTIIPLDAKGLSCAPHPRGNVIDIRLHDSDGRIIAIASVPTTKGEAFIAQFIEAWESLVQAGGDAQATGERRPATTTHGKPVVNGLPIMAVNLPVWLAKQKGLI